VLTLVEKAQEAFDAQSARKLEEKLKKDRFDLADFRDQLREIKKMGPLENVISMLPGMAGKIPAGAKIDDGSLRRVEAIVDSMTPKERRSPRLIDGSRRRRIASGSGTSVQEVNRLLRDFEEMEKMMKRFRNARGVRFPARRG
jgi:signal recognition particle subunit SRP54